MAHIEKTVFISYRRVDRWPALAVFKDLTQHGYDVFIDYDGLASGDFNRAIVGNIRARAHFVIILTPTALSRCKDPADWMRREIEVALDAQRNIVPLLLNGFTFEAPLVVERLKGSLAPLRHYHALRVPEDSAYFDAAMDLLRSKYLAIALDAVTQPASAHAQQVAQEQQVAALRAAIDPKMRLLSWAKLLVSAIAVMVYVVGSVDKKEDIFKHINLKPVFSIESVAYAEMGYAAAQLNLGIMYEQRQDDAMAVNWYRKAAEQGNATAQSNLGMMYEQGRGGIARDDAEAVKWYRRAASQGNVKAQEHLAFMYELGLGGLLKDRMRALKLYRQAAAQDSEYAKNALKRLGET